MRITVQLLVIFVVQFAASYTAEWAWYHWRRLRSWSRHQRDLEVLRRLGERWEKHWDPMKDLNHCEIS